jgi:hypothetical protein
MREIILGTHAFLGVVALLAGLWVFVEGINAGPANSGRIRAASVTVLVFLWLTYLVGGYWYVTYYYADKALILKGPWPLAHSLGTEIKEHLFFVLLMLGTYLPMVAYDSRAMSSLGGRRLLLSIAGLVVLLSLAMEGGGALIGLGVRVAVLSS